MKEDEKKRNECSAEFPEVLTVEEVAQLLRVNRKTVLELFHSKELPGKRLGKKIIRFSREGVLRSLNDVGYGNRSSRRSR